MTCSAENLKAYVVGELALKERGAVDDHVRACQSCREELDRLNLTRSALASLEDEEIPRRIAFVSDRVFEPRWWQTMWHSGPVMGFASAAVLAIAILAHGYVRPITPVAATPTVDTAQIERRVEAQVSARLDAAVTKAVHDAEAKQAADFAKLLTASEQQRREDLAAFQQASEYYQQQVARFEVASNEGAGR